ncbi:Tetratricopeptide repeat-containing protein [Aquimarina amphilecti]|uniref:Tetratricopeptide repeat-containing protein n=1 Tax=Aquimarina amphilecti TaxID=1038014 RepID=A0A1H7RL32_AQUAM|nr:tetratricopeptide repeat protein [Aquimarina amphilecti]SEL60956.1 Tetratricopeptide repeat-containing protein [Aquimarina amphilecti]
MIVVIHKSIKYFFYILIALTFIKVEAQDSQLKIADSLYTIGNFSEAIKSYKTIVPKDDYILLKIAKAHKAKGTYKDALNYYEKVILMNTELLSAKLEYAKLLMSTNQFKKADSVYSDLVAKHNDNPNFQYRLGLAKKKLKDTTAITYFEEAFRLDNTHQKSCFEVSKYYLKKRKYNTVEDTANKGLASYSENPELINVLAQNYLLQKYYSEAIPYFEKLIKLNHGNEFVHASLALCYHKDYEFKKAIEQYLQALTFNNQVPLRYTRLAQAYTSIKKYDEALTSFKMALELKDVPIDEDLYNIAMTYRHREEWENAIKHMKLAIRENPNYYNAQYQLATFADAYYKDPKVKLKYYNNCLKKLEASKEDNTFINFLKQTINKRVKQLEQEIEKK